MYFEWDEDKAAFNQAKHGVAFDAVFGFDFEAAMVRQDSRYPYGEMRWVAIGSIGSRLHVLVFTLRDDVVVRVISLRKANYRECKGYVEAKNRSGT